jgi:hypothetical protein
MNPTDILLGLEKIIDAIKSTSAAQFLMVAGFLSLIITLVSLIVVSRSPQLVPKWFRAVPPASLIFGVLFCAAGPSVALLSVNKYSIPKISQNTAYKNLQDNSEVTWLIRLIPYDPNDPKDNNELSIGNLKRLAPPSVRFTFVGPYQELKGYTVAEAVRRLTGGSLGQDMRVSAIIFHLNKKKVRLFPANARWLLQVVKYL